MNANELKSVLKNWIREEVRKEVSDQVNKSMARILAEMISSNKNTTRVNLDEQVTSINNNQPVNNNKKFVSNPALNEALNMTMNKIVREENNKVNGHPGNSNLQIGLEEPMGYIGRNLDSGIVNNKHEPQMKIDMAGGNINMLKSIVSAPVQAPPSVTEMPGVVPDSLKKIFNKDYRAVMKAVDEKKRGGSMGGYGTVGMM